MSQQGNRVSIGALEVYLFNGVSLRMGEAALSAHDSRSLKLWNVLCYLILHRDRAIPQSELVETFWSDEDQKNPTSALKMLILRTRSMLKPLLGGNIDPIIGRRGSYQWNPEIVCQVDVERFQALCAQAEKDPYSSSRASLLQEAVALYQGELLPRAGTQRWLLPLNERCRNLYVKAVVAYAALLEDEGDYEQMEAVCLRASSLSRLDEQLYTLVMRSMLLQKKYADAHRYYKESSDILYRELGVRPSAELQNLHDQALSARDIPTGNLSTILTAIREDALKGAYYCDYNVFQALCQVDARRAARSGNCLHIALLTLSSADGRIPDRRLLEPLMEALRWDVVTSLRQSDVVARAGENQYIISLLAANQEDSNMVVERIIASASRRFQASALKITYELHGLGEA